MNSMAAQFAGTRGSNIAIAGAGLVGTTLAYACMLRGVGDHIALWDRTRAHVDAEVADLDHGMQFVATCRIEGSDDVAVCKDADVIVITAGVKHAANQTRLDIAAQNAALIKEMAPKLMSVASPETVVLVVSNPVDVLTYVALKASGGDAHRVMGSGTVLDSARLRFLIAQRCKVAVQSVHAFIAGEHGDSEIPLWSSAAIANVPLHEWAVQGHGKLSVRDRAEIFQAVKTAGPAIQAAKGATNFAIALATTRILEAILHDSNRVLPVSSLLSNFRGISDVCLSLPSIVNRGGVETTLPIPLNENELAGLRNSAETVRGVLKTIGF